MTDSDSLHRPGRRRAGRSLLVPILLVVAAAGGYSGYRYLNAGRPPVMPMDLSEVDPEVATLVREMAAELEKEPANGRKHGSLGLVYEANTMWPEAAASFANAAALASEEPLWAYHCARATINMGDQDGGYAMLLKAAKRVPNEPGVQLYLAHQLLDAGEYDQAQVALNTVVRVLPERAEGYAGQGELLVAREDYEGAVRVLKRALDLDPNLMISHYSLGLAYRGLGRLDEAEQELALGLQAKRMGIADKFGAETQGYGVNYVGVINNSSDLIEEGKYDAAIAILEKMRKTRPDDSNLLNNLGIAYMRKKQLDTALTHFKHALEIDETFFGTHQNLASCYQEMKDLSRAAVHGERAVELGGEVASTHFTLLRILARLGRFDEALVNAQAAARLDPTDPVKHTALGELYAQLKRPRDARKSFEAAVEVSPNYLPSRINLLHILVGLGELEKASAMLAESEALAPGNPRIQNCRRLYENARRQRAANPPKKSN